MIYIGIDPGINGAWAWVKTPDDPDDGPVRACAFTFPLAGDSIDIVRLRDDISIRSLAGAVPAVVALERAQAMPKNGAVSMFNYGVTYGSILAMCKLLGFRTELVRPPAWKKVVLAGTTKDKAAAIEYVTRAFPGVSLLATERSRTPHDGMADALCLAEYGRRMFPS